MGSGPNSDDTYTQQLSRNIDAAYEGYSIGAPDGEEVLYRAFRAQAANVVQYHPGADRGNLVNDIAGRAMMSLRSFRGESALSTWFWTLAQNEVKRALRQLVENRNRLVPLETGEDPDDDPMMKIPASPADPDVTILLEQVLSDVPPAQAEVLRLVEEGRSLEDIARRTGAPLGTIRGRRRLALSKARKKIAPK